MATSRTPTVRQRRLGAELRRLREERNLTGDGVAETLGWSPSKVSRIENARIGARVSDVRLMLELYQVDPAHQREVLALAEEAGQRGWWAQYPDLPPEYAAFIALEDEADAALQCESQVIPGLLQTEEYARHVIQGWNAIATLPPQALERRVEVRMRRQRLLTRPNPLRLSVVLDESVLLRRVGDRSTMYAQLNRLLELAALPNVDLRVLPLDGPHQPIVGESFILLEFSPAYDVTFPDVVHTESLTATQSQHESVTHSYRLAWDSLAHQTLGSEESLERIFQIARERWRV
ncbi:MULTISPECIES: helix-turn-helix domain-containing protein [Thermomonospora]|uniref:Helix-turn-helix domain protein n=1 Tax=Thermomonospora curvata (strain ATCC 19995 / DSM 43183 / JCM 3096 / KCTC 9072 / NBRC 15933 / NCIMB 10081 / Henssen B9) TaxID=471852 RepID=D1A327_THECD|nr:MULTISPECIES: helix-turn-helix transcriptional regulator [Thermomonospora]ACY99797.1 helix-turn-helix domain protein [Thermomonospora curvata DSM 43183]PKK12804.1 MAG: XRE family transcriptional regulator [Thermomonospora sp. CIF 1]